MVRVITVEHNFGSEVNLMTHVWDQPCNYGIHRMPKTTHYNLCTHTNLRQRASKISAKNTSLEDSSLTTNLATVRDVVPPDILAFK